MEKSSGARLCWAITCLDLLEFIHTRAFQVAFAGFRIDRLGRKTVLNRKSIGKNPLKHRIFKQFGIHLGFRLVIHRWAVNPS